MTDLYRLGVIRSGNGPECIVELNGRLLTLEQALDGEVELGTGTADLQPVLDRWDECESAITEFVNMKSRAFDKGLLGNEAEFLPPIAKPGKLICIGANYWDHIEEMPVPMTPSYPYAFAKPANNTVRGTGDSVAVPRTARMVDWEAELGVVIGRTCTNVSIADALSVVAGYVNFNDLSARDWIERRPPIGIDWIRHKAFDGFAPMGPFVVPSRFVPDPQNLSVRLSVNGVIKQDSNTSQMVFGVAAIVEHLASIMTLYPGDIIATGTPAGTGHGLGEYLRPGDVIRMEIGPLGELVTPIV